MNVFNQYEAVLERMATISGEVRIKLICALEAIQTYTMSVFRWRNIFFETNRSIHAARCLLAILNSERRDFDSLVNFVLDFENCDFFKLTYFQQQLPSVLDYQAEFYKTYAKQRIDALKDELPVSMIERLRDALDGAKIWSNMYDHRVLWLADICDLEAKFSKIYEHLSDFLFDNGINVPEGDTIIDVIMHLTVIQNTDGYFVFERASAALAQHVLTRMREYKQLQNQKQIVYY